MKISALRRRRPAWLLFALFLLVIFFSFLAADAGSWLIVDEPKPADVILVLAGETDRRPARAVQLLRQGLAPRMVMDVPADASIYGYSQLELAQKWVQTLPEAGAISICSIAGLSTRDEARDVAECLAHDSSQTKSDRILIVTSDFHTRRARSVFQHELQGKSFSIAAARDDAQFGARWWTHRQWAKTCVDEWMRVVWWNAVDHWR